MLISMVSDMIVPKPLLHLDTVSNDKLGWSLPCFCL
jgi:hypothetical protein